MKATCAERSNVQFSKRFAFVQAGSTSRCEADLINRFLTALAILWASPWTLLGLSLGVLGLATGGKAQRVGRVIEFHGGVLPRLLARAPFVAGAAAITFGHTVLGRTPHDLEFCRSHELVHVRQYERWGPFFIPAYLLFGVALMLCRKHAYWDNPFEREAYEKEDKP